MDANCVSGAPADEKTPKFSVELPSPVIRVFDVIKYSGEDETLDSEDLLVLPQPGIRTREDGREDRTFVGFTEEGTCFAMSEEDFPYVTDRASEAKCYDRTAEWDQLPEVERRKLLVGVHRTHGPETNNFNNPHMLSLPGRESDTGNSRKESTSPSPHVHSTLTLTPGLWESGQYPKVLGTIAAVFLCAIWIASKAANIERFRPNAAKLPSESPANEVLGNLTSDAMQPQQPPQALVDKPLPSLPVQPIPDGSLPDAVEIAVGDNTVEVPTIVAEPAAPKTSGVRFVDEPAILELPKVEEETAAEELPRATTPVQEHDAVPPTTPEGKKKKRQRGRRGGKNTKKKDQSESTSEAAEKTEDEREEEKEKEKETKMKNIVISDGDVKEMNPGTSYVLNKLEIDEQDVIGMVFSSRFGIMWI